MAPINLDFLNISRHIDQVTLLFCNQGYHFPITHWRLGFQSNIICYYFNKMRISLIIILFLFCTYTFADFNAQVVRVIDGDTIQVKDNLGHKFKIRLLGIDTPEIKQAFGKESSDYLKSIVTCLLYTSPSPRD